MLSDLIFRIKNGDNVFFILLNRAYKNLMSFSIPCIKPIHNILWWERCLRQGSWQWLLKSFYYTPLFKSQCYKVGKNLNLVNGLPEINENIKLVIGNNICIYSKNTSFGGGKLNKKPKLEIGDNTFIGPGVKIGICEDLTIGKYCLIAARVIIIDNDGHPLNYEKRRGKTPVSQDEVRPVVIGDDVWVGEGSFICKGVRIGNGAIIAARSVVTKDVPEFTIVGGNPARMIRQIDNKE